MLDYEQHLFAQGYSLIAGCDEAGRGPLCGPVVSACCVLPVGYVNEAIDDSKKLSEKKREALYDEIVRNALHFAIVAISPEEIDRINIYEASRKGMIEAIRASGCRPDYILTDCMPLHTFSDIPQESLVKGDARAMCIAAASILAKVTRDRIMIELDRQYPEYRLARHKGYPTKEHLELLKKYGPVKGLYRYSYRPVREALSEQLTIF